jgi:inner membrane protein
MENITHSLFGVALYRSGFERYVPNSVLLWVIGANLPDIDVVVNLFGKAAYLDHHRGFTHSIPGVIVLSALLATAWFFFEQKRYSLNKSKSPPEENTKTWLRLFLASLLAVGTHPMLDSLNNYGVRPLQPWSQKWFYGDLVFIVDPWIWLILGGAVFLSSVRSRNLTALWAVVAFIAWQVMFFSGRVANLALTIWAVAVSLVGVLRLVLKDRILASKVWLVRGALLLFCTYLVMLFYFQSQALEITAQYLKTQIEEEITKFSVSPTAANPFRWEFLTESQSYFYYGTVDLINNNVTAPKRIFVDRKSPILEQALNTREGQAIKSFSRYLIAEQQATSNGTWVTLCDGRYVRDFRGSHPEFACVKILVTK